MGTNQTSNSKEQEQQAQKNKQAASAKADTVTDKKLDGPNRPSV
ncbi:MULTISPECIES: hypothetical protein [Paenibacillus]|uniref:Uncharacterized protein n=1 Tax=Paenibacillus radicis (ex Xue et al. 2023) TaxID=2972489 RepID=A0ABT1YUL9_9BACL|nr:hypothetical protein [Paenibacillus radicis (ex Xue et al. 2023)]MCR8636374.1 hypothetical protein [Paenibacillus radicis (ex Xue et al. 2023)]